MACDMCGKKGVYLTPLNDGYKTDDIQQVCSECGDKINDHLWKMRSITHGFIKTTLKRYMSNYKLDILEKD